MQYPVNQANQLPFSAQQPTQGFMRVDVNNPPYMPNLPCPPELRPFLGNIAGLAAQEIQTKAQSNPLRMFMFNQYAVNGFANPAFEAMMVVMVDYITLRMLQRMYPTIENAITACVPQVVEMLCAMNVQQFPQLATLIPPQLQPNVQGMMVMFNNVVGEIQAMKNQMGMGGGGGWNTGAAPAQSWNNVSNWGVPQGGGWNAGMAVGQGAIVQPSTGSSNLFGGRRASDPMTLSYTNDRYDGDDRYDRTSSRQQIAEEILKQPFVSRGEQKMEQQQPQAATAAPAQEQRARADSGEIKWKPSPKFPYLPAYNPSTHILYLRKLADNTVEPDLERIMDYKRHALTTTAFGPVPPTLDLNQRVESLDRIAQEITVVNGGTPAEQEEAERPEPTTFQKKSWIVETSLSAAWLVVDLDRLSTRQTNGDPDVYRAYAKIARPVVAMEDETAVVKNFANSSTFLELREKLNASLPDISPALWELSNRRMTVAVNRAVRQNLSIPKLAMGSFVNDIEDLIKYLGQQFGDEIKNALLKHERSIIRQTLMTLEESTAASLTEGLIDSLDYEEGKSPKITYVSADYSLTYLNCRSHQLEIQLPLEGSAAVTEKFTPVMYAIVEKLLEETRVEGFDFSRHLIRTNDGRVLEATQGFLGDKFYLLTVVE